VENTFNMRK